jgi:23S rRNA (guanosine2251-2'-O)-methyltransferase
MESEKEHTRRFRDEQRGERRDRDAFENRETPESGARRGDVRPGRAPRPTREFRRPEERRPREFRRPEERMPREFRRPEERMPLEEESLMRENELQENLLAGRNPIREALKSGRDMEKLLIARGELMGSAREIVAMAREQHVVVQEVDRAKLDAMLPGHQGMIAVVSAYRYSTLEDMLELARSRGEDPFLVILDGITDPHNLGAIIRSAECAGAHGVIIPERRSVGLTPAAVKASAGAVEHIPVAREVNLSRVLDRLKAENVWIFGADAEGEDYRKVDFSGPAALVIGSEGDGMSRLVARGCDRIVSLPIRGKIDSLNASVAAGILLYAIAGTRGKR